MPSCEAGTFFAKTYGCRKWPESGMMPLRAFPGVGVCGLPGGVVENASSMLASKVAVKGVFVAGLA